MQKEFQIDYVDCGPQRKKLRFYVPPNVCEPPTRLHGVTTHFHHRELPTQTALYCRHVVTWKLTSASRVCRCHHLCNSSNSVT
jgi:hypothetical protein